MTKAQAKVIQDKKADKNIDKRMEEQTAQIQNVVQKALAAVKQS